MAETGTIEVQMPQMGESVTEGTILEWHVEEGQEVAEGDTVVEVSTDKIDAEVPAPAAGVITKILAGVDDTVEVGQVLAQIDPNGTATAAGNGASAAAASSDGAGSAAPTEGADLVMGGGEGDADIGDDEVEAESSQPGVVTADAAKSAEPGAEPDPATPEGEAEEGSGASVTISMPEMGESVTEGTVLEWHVEEGQQVAEGDTVIEVSTDKIDAEVPAPAAGTITKLLVEVDETVQVGQALAELRAERCVLRRGGLARRALPASRAPAPTAATEQDGRASPVARRVAAARGVDIGSVTGSAPGGKVTKSDVLAAAENGATAAPAVTDGEAKPLRGPAAMLAQAMEESREVPTATSFRTLPVDTLDAKRKAINGELKERGMKVSFTHLVAWAIVEAAREWPVMGRSFEVREGKPHLIEHSEVNLGIAVDVERKGGRSLMVPAIKGAQALDFAGFHSRYEELITKTRENKLTADDFQGTNISLTNPGGIGTVASVPRLMKGQGTIIATGSIAYPVEWAHAPADKIKALGVSKVMTMTSTYDHRIIQGAESGSFLRRIDQLLQGEDEFYETVAESLKIPTRVVTNAHAASASAPPLGGAAAAAGGPMVQAEPDRELLQAVQAATSLLKAYRTHGHLASRAQPARRRAQGRPGAGAGEPQPDPRADAADPGLDPADRRRGRDPARGAAADARRLLRDDRLPDRAPLLPPAADVAARHDRDRLASRSRYRPRRSAPCSRGSIQVFQFERFVQKAYLGQKMFSIEGLDVTVPMIDELVTLARRAGAEEVVLGMAHRGRLSVLVHNLGRSVESILAEFEGAKALDRGQGDRGDPARGYRRRQVPPRRRGHVRDPRRRADQGPPLPEPVPPRVRRPGRHRRRARRPDRALRTAAEAQPARRGAAAAPRRRGLPRPGNGRRDPQPAGACGLLDRRHGPHHHRQPGRLHHRSGGGPLDPLRRRPGEGLQLPDHPRQRRRRRGVRLGDAPGDGLPRALGARRRHRPDRLPPLRPQRDRRARLHPAADGGEDQEPPSGHGDLRRGAGQGGRGHARGCRGRRRRAPAGATRRH